MAKTVNTQKRKLVEVTWVDSAAHNGWHYGCNIYEVCLCSTAGYLLQRDKKQIVVALSQSLDNDGVGDCISIPAVAVKKVVQIGNHTGRRVSKRNSS